VIGLGLPNQKKKEKKLAESGEGYLTENGKLGLYCGS